MKNEILNITSLRFLIAFYVFLFHCHFHFGAIKDNSEWITNLIKKGPVGMSAFFILSGYILTYVYPNISTNCFKKYYINRIARIYPTYIISGLLTFPFYLLSFNNLNEEALLKIIFSVVAFIFMIQAWFPPLFSTWNFGGSWSLSVEAFFYLLFPIIYPILKKINAKKLIVICIICYLWASLPIFYINIFSNDMNYQMMDIYTYSSPIFRLGEFVIGIIICILLKERKLLILKNPIITLTLIIIWLIFLIMPNLSKGLSFYTFISIPTFVWIITFFSEKRIYLLNSKFLVGLGRISYSFYLTQFLSVFLINQINMAILFKWILAFWVTLIISICIYFIIEKPFRTYILNHWG